MKIVITARNFGAGDGAALKLLRDAGHEVVDHSGLGCGTGTTEEEMAALLGDAEAVITGLEPIGRTVISRCPHLRLLSKRSIGYDSVDVEACRAAGITVTRLTGMVEGAVAEHALAQLLWFARSLPAENAAMHAHSWQRTMSYGAKSRTLGLVGFGGIGREIARRALPFGMKILYYARTPHPELEAEYGVSYTPFDSLLAQSDYIVAAVNLSDSTRGMFNAAAFAKMRPQAVFLNIARSGVMDAAALKDALDRGLIRGAAIDVFDTEPCTDSPLAACPNALLTPHTAPFTSENFQAMNVQAAQNVLDFVNGTIQPRMRLV